MQVDLLYEDGRLNGVNFTYRQVYQYELLQDIELGVWYPIDNANAQFNYYNYSFTYGEYALELPYGMSDFQYTSFDLINTLDQPVETVTIENGANTSLRLGNAQPASASYQFDTPKCRVVEGSTGNVSYSFNTYNGTLTVTGSKIGEVTLEVSTKNVTKQITVNVVEPAVTGLNMKTYTAPANAGGNYSAAAVTGAYKMYEGQSVLLGAQITPNGASQEYTLTANSDEVSISLEAEDAKTYGLSYQTINVDIYRVSVAKAGTYTLTATSVKDPTKSATMTLDIQPLPTVSDVVVNDYWHYYGGNGRAVEENIYISFQPSADSDAVGKVTIRDSFTNKNEQVADDLKVLTYVHDYTYDAATKRFSLSTAGVAESYYLQVSDDFTSISIQDTAEEKIAIAGFTTKVYDPGVYLIAEWYEDAPRPLGDLCIMLNTNGRGQWNWEFSFTYSYTINEDGSISVVIVKKNLNQICEVMGLDSITSIVLDPTYEVLTMTYVEGGTSKTTTFSNGF